VLKGQRATINWAALGYAVEVSLRITLDKTEPRAFDEFLAAAREVPEVTRSRPSSAGSMRGWP
jgi:Lrp/AsnC family transcriptional regulator